MSIFDEEVMIGMDLEDSFLVEVEGDETKKMFLVLVPYCLQTKMKTISHKC